MIRHDGLHIDGDQRPGTDQPGLIEVDFFVNTGDDAVFASFVQFGVNSVEDTCYIAAKNGRRTAGSTLFVSHDQARQLARDIMERLGENEEQS